MSRPSVWRRSRFDAEVSGRPSVAETLLENAGQSARGRRINPDGALRVVQGDDEPPQRQLTQRNVQRSAHGADLFEVRRSCVDRRFFPKRRTKYAYFFGKTHLDRHFDRRFLVCFSNHFFDGSQTSQGRYR
jgi:hypothetical protein